MGGPTVDAARNADDLSILSYHNSQGVRYLGSCMFFLHHTVFFSERSIPSYPKP